VNAPTPAVVVEVEPVEPLADPLTVFAARAEAMARAWKSGEILLCDAADAVQQAAEAYGLVIELGQDAVQALMAGAFAAVPSEGAPAANLPDDQYPGPSTFAAACRVADRKQARKPHDPDIERVRPLLNDDVSLERAWREIKAERLRRQIPEAVLQAAVYFVQQGDANRWRKWFDARSPEERAAILQHLEEREGRRGK
jgi:hypothetical protein